MTEITYKTIDRAEDVQEGDFVSLRRLADHGSTILSGEAKYDPTLKVILAAGYYVNHANTEFISAVRAVVYPEIPTEPGIYLMHGFPHSYKNEKAYVAVTRGQVEIILGGGTSIVRSIVSFENVTSFEKIADF